MEAVVVVLAVCSRALMHARAPAPIAIGCADQTDLAVRSIRP